MTALIFDAASPALAGSYDRWTLPGFEDGEICRTETFGLYIAAAYSADGFMDSGAVPFALAEAWLRRMASEGPDIDAQTALINAIEAELGNPDGSI